MDDGRGVGIAERGIEGDETEGSEMEAERDVAGIGEGEGADVVTFPPHHAPLADPPRVQGPSAEAEPEATTEPIAEMTDRDGRSNGLHVLHGLRHAERSCLLHAMKAGMTETVEMAEGGRGIMVGRLLGMMGLGREGVEEGEEEEGPSVIQMSLRLKRGLPGGKRCGRSLRVCGRVPRRPVRRTEICGKPCS